MTTETSLCRFVCIGLLLLLTPGLGVAGDKKKSRQPEALIAGTVFQDNGRLLPGAKVRVIEESSGKKRGQAFTDRRGEFAIRVPAGRARYLVEARAKGFEPQQKTVEVYESEKATVNFLLSPK